MTFETDVAARVLAVFRESHGNVQFDLRFAEQIKFSDVCRVLGECDFSHEPPRISIKSGLNKSDLIEALCHELAHLHCGLEGGHNERWEKCRDDLSVRVGASYMPEGDA